MNYSKAVFLINKSVRAISTIYEAEPANGGKMPTKTLFKTLDSNIAVGDFVTVPSNTRHNITVVKVVDVDVDIDFDASDQMQWVIGIIDKTAYTKVLRQEQIAIATMKSAELKEKREALAASLFKNRIDSLKTLEIADMSAEVPAPAPAPAPAHPSIDPSNLTDNILI